MDGIGVFKKLDAANQIRRQFESGDIDDVLGKIAQFPRQTQQDQATANQLYELYRSYISVNRPDQYDVRFRDAVLEKIKSRLESQFTPAERGNNREGLAYLRRQFLSTIYPLIESFRVDPRTKAIVSQYLDTRDEGGQRVNPKLQFVQRLNRIAQQRDLTEVEQAYLKSTELLSVFNPYLVAVNAADSGVTSEFLRHHFEKVTKQTVENLQDGDYVPLLQIGLGPNGLAALGEIARINPDLAAQMLVVDANTQPAGPFAIPGGPAWELNSANKRGGGGPILPNSPGSNERETVRSYGSPLRWYPGQRGAGSDVRAGSINVTVDYLPSPDDTSTIRYPTNEELSGLLSLQAALLSRNLAFQTRVISVEPNPNEGERGNKIVTLQIGDNETGRRIKIKTDAVFTGTGLGEPTYGFEIMGSRAEQVLESTKDFEGFPKLSTTLEAFKALTDRTSDPKSPGETLVIWGSGNSTDTIVEFIGNLFQGENPRVRDVTKIYIVAEKDLSERPRYSALNDLKPRNGRGNLIEFVKARVTDADFATQDGEPGKRKIIVFGSDGQPIVDSKGSVITADSGIAATGFKPKLDEIFAAYLSDGQSFSSDGDNSPVVPLTLPTNEKVAVADVLSGDPDVLFIGTASKSRFGVDKLKQLPKEARQALLRAGAKENAVAIGFRAPDTQAAVNIWLNSRDVVLEPQQVIPKFEVALDGDVTPESEPLLFDSTVNSTDLKIPNNISDDSLLLSPLLAYNIGNAIEVQGGFTGGVDFTLTFNEETASFKLQFKGGSSGSISTGLTQATLSACTDEYFQRYAINALRKRRRNPQLELSISFKNGKMDPRNTFVQTI